MSDNLARMIRTPVGDLLRGRVSGTTVRRQAQEAQLPVALTTLVDRTLRRTRLPHRERQAMAAELIAQLQDSLLAGITEERLAQQFGDPEVVARLLRWACQTRRSRPRRWLGRAIAIAGVAVILLIATAAGLIIRFERSQPVITRDFLAEINQEGHSVAEADRAWPLYREALLKLEPFPGNDAEISEQAYLEQWPVIADYLKRNRSAFDLAHQASQRPHLGHWYGDPGDKAWLDSLPNGLGNPAPPDTPLSQLPTPHLDELARLRRLLLADTRRATAGKDIATCTANLQTLLGMAQQLRDGTPTVMTELRAFACCGTALQLTGMMLKEQPALFREKDLVDLAHRFARFSGGGTLRIRLDGERRLFDDFLQRAFTDNGLGDGHLTAQGYSMWDQIENDAEPIDPARLGFLGRAEATLRGTAIALVTASRSENSALAERLLLRFQAERAGALWQWETSTAESMIQELAEDRIARLRYWPIVRTLPGLQHIVLRGEVLTQQREATLTAIALELYRRRHNTWPQTLKELTPFPLPDVPLDRFTGKPLKYRLVEGRPLLYSTGMDRDDDGGRAHRMGNDLAQRWEPWVKVSQPPRIVSDGFGKLVQLPPKFDWDWILWPPPDPPPPELDEGDSSE